MFDITIIGAGPAGLTAALYASRAGLKTLVLEKGAAGGKVFTTHLVENYPGFTSIGGRELSMKFKENGLAFGAEYRYGEVLQVEKQDKIYKVKTNMEEIETKALILATGTINRLLEVKGEVEYLGKGVSYCAICDGNFFKGKDVVVVGGGNSALEEALYLADICNSVTIVHRRQEFRAEQFIIDSVMKKKNITFELDQVVEEISGDNLVEVIRIKDVNTNDIKEIKASAIFIYVGLIPLTNNFEDLEILDENKNIIVDSEMRTPKPYIYGAGDVIKKHLRQITTAVNDGAIAAQSAINDLKEWD